MPDILTVMNIARGALNTATRQLDTVSHNVANVNTEGYSRQEVVQGTRSAESTNEGWYGTGVHVLNVIQYVDSLVLERITDKISAQSYYESRLSVLSRVESLANEAGDTGLGSELTAFFNAWQEVSDDSKTTAVREVLNETAHNLINRLNTLMDDLQSMDQDLDLYLSDAVNQVNDISKRIAQLNVDIVLDEASGASANDLRDERVRQLNELSELLDIQWFEDANGAVNVVTGTGKTLVQHSYPEADVTGEPLAFTAVTGYDENQVVWQNLDLALDSSEITGGKIGAWLELREQDIPEAQSFFNDLARTIVFEVNKLHSSGAGLEEFTDLTGTYELSSATTSFADLAATAEANAETADPTAYIADYSTTLIQDGSFDIWVYESGTRRQYTIDVEATDTLTTLKDKINLAMGDGVSTPNSSTAQNPVAYITEDNQLRLVSSGDIEYLFANDTSYVLAGLGLNTYFDGYSASNISLNSNVESDVRNVAAGRLTDDGELAEGENGTALDIADLRDADTMNNGTDTFNGAVISWASGLGTQVATAEAGEAYAATARDELLDQRDSVSAVSLDEEMVKMIQYQRSYQMAAKLISVADTLLATILETKS